MQVCSIKTSVLGIQVSVTDMNTMFKDASAFNQDINTNGNKWNTSIVTDMSSMFKGAEKFDGDISGWNTSSVTNMSAMFSGASVFNQNLKAVVVGDTIGILAMVGNMSAMFAGAIAFNGDMQ